MTIVIALPDVLLSTIFSNWISIVDVARLDSALCRHGAREDFMTIAYNSATVLQYSEKVHDLGDSFNDMNAWIFLRSVSVPGFWVTEVFLENHTRRGEHLRHRGGAIRWMEFECDPEEDIGEISLSYLDVAMYCANLTRLEGAWLIDDEVLCKLAQGCPLLEELSRLGKGRSDQAVSALAKHCSKLQRLSLTSTATEDSLIALVRNNPGLHDLYLSGGDITNRFVRELSLSCSRLKELSLSHAELDIYTVYYLLGQCKCLTSLTFEQLDIGRDEEMPPPGPFAPTGLLSLTFEDAGITDAELNILLNACPALTSLLLSGCEALLHLHAIPMCPALEDLSLYDNGSAAGDLTLWQLAHHCPGLSALRIPGSPLVSEIGARAVFENCPLLEELDLDESQITDASLIALGQNGRHVNTLYLRDCTEVTNVGIEAVMGGCTRLAEFGVEGCTKLTARLVRAIHKRYDSLGRD